jgi:hypothetical protein
MKKIIFSLAFSAALLSSAFTYAAGRDTNVNEPTVIVKQAFAKEFKNIANVEWTTLSKEGVYQAKFSFNNEPLQAFFTEDGEFLGTTRQVVLAQLPVAVSTELEKQYTDYRVVTIFEYSKRDGLNYYITLCNSKGAMIVKATGNGELTVYKKKIQ